MWDRYRKLKPGAATVLIVVAALSLTGTPDTSMRWLVGVAAASMLILAYLAEEVVWIARNRGRPCPKCGALMKVQAFRLQTRCPRCGEMP